MNIYSIVFWKRHYKKVTLFLYLIHKIHMCQKYVSTQFISIVNLLWIAAQIY